MRYVGRTPPPPLDQFVDDIYVLSGVPEHQRLIGPPMPSAHLMINLGDPVHLRDSDPSVHPAVFTDGWFLGMWKRRLVVEFESSVRVVGVHFKPWGVAPFISVPLSDLRDRWVPLDAVWEGSFDRIRRRLIGASSTEAALRLVEGELRDRLDVASLNGLDLVRRAAGHLEESWGAVPVAALADHAGISGNRLAGLFTAHVGMTPKRLGRIYRFARVILSVDAARPVGWAELAQTTGYFDQPHLVNEFKDFTGRTPTDYLALRRRFPAEPGYPPDRGPMPSA
jgi:AraC-like DNA-binding protein